MREYWLDPPEPKELDYMDITQVIEIELDAEVTIRSDGNWDYIDTSYAWARNPDSSDGDWYTDEGHVQLTDHMGLVEKVDELIETRMPAITGRYKIKGHIELVFEVTDIGVDKEVEEDSYVYETYIGDSAYVDYMANQSKVEDFSFEVI